MYATLCLGGGYTLNPVSTGFKTHLAVGAFASQAQNHLFVAAEFTEGLADKLMGDALVFAVACVHTQQVRRKQGRLVAASPCANFNERIALIIRVFG